MERMMVSLFLLKGDQVLLLFREGGRVANHRWVAACGGHMEREELNNARAAALREMQEELGLWEGDVGQVRLRYITLRNAGDEIRQNYYFFAELETEKPLSSNEGQLQWFDEDSALKLPMPLTAQPVLAHYFAEGKKTNALYGGIHDGKQMHFVPMQEHNA